jgi:Leucine-rich repeat (LRR) protein
LTLSTSHFPRSRSAIAFVCALAIFGLPSCQSGQFIERLSTSPTQDYLHTFVQKGTTTLRDGQQTEVRFNEAFESVPRLTIVGFNQSWFQRRPYAKDDFEIVQLNSASFTVQNNHREQSEGSWAIIEWRAEGTRRSSVNLTKEEQLIATVKKKGGHVTSESRNGALAVVGIDAHRCRITDSDLASIDTLTCLRTVNLYGTNVTDATLVHLFGLVGLKVLDLNDTAITDSGLQTLQRLTGLQELDVCRTRISDDGLACLSRLTSLQTLALNGCHVTDVGLRQLKGLRNLKQLYIANTRVSEAGLQELRQALPRLMIIR